MKKAIKKLIRIREQIQDIKTHIELTKISAYFSIFSTEEKRKEEILFHKNELKKLMKKEFTALENLQKQCEMAKVKNSNKSVKLNLETNENRN